MIEYSKIKRIVYEKSKIFIVGLRMLQLDMLSKRAFGPIAFVAVVGRARKISLYFVSEPSLSPHPIVKLCFFSLH